MSFTQLVIFRCSRTGGRVVEGTSLENWHTGNGIESSNLSLSVLVPALGVELSQLEENRCWDGWPSGLRRTPGKCVYVKAYRGFESHPVRVHLYNR